MKQVLIGILLCVAGLRAFAQTDSVHVWNKWCSSRDTMLLFEAANNTIQVCCRALKPSEIILKPVDKTLRIGKPEVKGDTISVLAMPYPSRNKPMRLAVLNAKTKKTLRTVDFYSDEVPAPVARVGNIQTSEALRKDILAQNSLKVAFPKSLYSYPYTVKQYIFKVHTPAGSATVPVNGFYLTKSILAQIKDAPAGTILEFTDIKATCPECATRDLGDMKLKIK
jgi:hypothetical protein